MSQSRFVLVQAICMPSNNIPVKHGASCRGCRIGPARQLWRSAEINTSWAALGSPVKVYPTRHRIIGWQRGISVELRSLLLRDTCPALHERYHNTD